MPRSDPPAPDATPETPPQGDERRPDKRAGEWPSSRVPGMSYRRFRLVPVSDTDDGQYAGYVAPRTPTFPAPEDWGQKPKSIPKQALDRALYNDDFSLLREAFCNALEEIPLQEPEPAPIPAPAAGAAPEPTPEPPPKFKFRRGRPPKPKKVHPFATTPADKLATRRRQLARRRLDLIRMAAKKIIRAQSRPPKIGGLAAALGVHRNTLNYWRRNPKINELLARILNPEAPQVAQRAGR